MYQKDCRIFKQNFHKRAKTTSIPKDSKKNYTNNEMMCKIVSQSQEGVTAVGLRIDFRKPEVIHSSNYPNMAVLGCFRVFLAKKFSCEALTAAKMSKHGHFIA